MNICDYQVDVQRLSENLGGGYVAAVPELKGCIADGDTREEALRNAHDAIACWIETAKLQGRQIPQPRATQRQYAH